MLSNKSDFDYIVSSNKLYELSRFVEASMDYLEIKYEKNNKLFHLLVLSLNN